MRSILKAEVINVSRTKLKDRQLPNYSRREEIANMVTHIVGGGLGVISLGLCIAFSTVKRNWWGLVGGIIYSVMMIFLYTMSSVYHGLKHEQAKKVLQVLDHCSIFALIIGTYVPILLTGVRAQSIVLLIVLSCIVFVGAAIGIVFTAIDFKKYAAVSMTGYFAVGWAALLILKPLYDQFGLEMIIWLVSGGVAYTLGIIFYALGRKKEYFHMIFHLFILAGSILHFIAIFKFCILSFV